MKWFNFDWLLTRKKEKKTEDSPYRSLKLINNTLIVLLHDGTTLIEGEKGKEVYKKVKEATTEEDVLAIFFPIDKTDKKQLVKQNWSSLLEYEFYEKGDDLYMEGVNLPLPPVVIASFIQAHDDWQWKEGTDADDFLTAADRVTALRCFWMWCALNPIKESREDLLSFVENNDISITKNGLLEMYRRVVKVDTENDKEKVEAISYNYFKIKRWKKSPLSYTLYKTQEGSYEVLKNGTEVPAHFIEKIGNLQDLYLNLSNVEENIYTDNHTKSKEIKIGQIYREDEEDIDLDNKKDCSRGLTCSPVV